jgi:endo-1,4-beta-xylanase
MGVGDIAEVTEREKSTMTRLIRSHVRWLRALLPAAALALSCAADAQTEPVIIEAESGNVSPTIYNTGDLEGATYITIIADSPGFAPPTVAEGAVIYNVTFPSAGAYELYARFRVGPGGGSDDSFFIGNGFGDRFASNGPWQLINQVDGGGYTAPADTVRNGGPATTNVFKWFKITGFAGPAVWTVPEGALTQQLSFAGRETGNFIDKFAFGRAGSFYTVNDLDTGGPATGTPPPPDPPPFTRSGPPLGTGHEPKFLGSAHSPQNSLNFGAYWNQVTPENGGKWATVESTRDVYNFTEVRAAYNQARSNGQVFKWHVLFWGNQQPLWIESLSTAEQLEEIREWLAAIAAEFPDLEQIEVVNEPLHDPPRGPSNGNYIEALGGDGATGWDWIINAFTLARQYFPNAKLMLNDFSITNDGNATTTYLQIIRLLQERGLIDLIGVQGHAFSTTGPMSTHTANIARLAETGLPIYVTELDIDGNDDPVQLASYQRIFPTFWENPAIKGVTMWGYTRNGHWRRAQGAWLMYQNGAERPALQWLVSYMENELPVITAGQRFTIGEDAENGAAVGVVAATDSDVGQTLSAWQIDGGSGAGVFAIDAASGAISVVDAAALDFEATTSYTLTVSVYDGFRRSAGANVAIHVDNVNDNPPVVTAGQNFRIDGGVRNVVGLIAASDADEANEPGFTQLQDWTIVSGDPARAFDIDEGNGALRVARPTAIDFRRSSYTLAVNVGDGDNTSATQSLTVSIPDRVTVCLLIVELQVPKKAAPPLLKAGASLGRCRAK